MQAGFHLKLLRFSCEGILRQTPLAQQENQADKNNLILLD